MSLSLKIKTTREIKKNGVIEENTSSHVSNRKSGRDFARLGFNAQP
jgi:hypothetical protein